MAVRQHVREVLGRVGRAARRFVQAALAPAPGEAGGPGRGLLADLARSKTELLAENAFLRQQLLVAARHVRKPRFRVWDRLIMVMLAAVVTNWRSAVILVKPETLLRWHRDVFRLLWKWRSRRKTRAKPRLSAETVALIRRMAAQNRLWGAERIRGELLKLGLAAAKSTIQKVHLSNPQHSVWGPAMVDLPQEPGSWHLVLRPL